MKKQAHKKAIGVREEKIAENKRQIEKVWSNLNEIHIIDGGIMKKYIPVVARVLLGLVFFMSGIVGLFNLVPVPEDLPERLRIFNEGMAASGYMMGLVKLTETICGLLLVSGFFVPLALVILAPIVINIFFVHLFMAPDGLILATILGLLMIYLSFFSAPYSPAIRQLFKMK